MAKRESIPQPLRALRTLIREARKAERDDPQHRTAGEIIYGSVSYSGVKHLHRMAIEFDNFICAANQYEEIEVPKWERQFGLKGGKRGKDSRT